MYLLQFRLQFFYEYSLFIQEIVIIKATRLQAWALAGGGGGGRSRPSPPSKIKKIFLGYIFWYDFPSGNSRNLHLLHKNNAIVGCSQAIAW